jgi:hypothetical protein
VEKTQLRHHVSGRILGNTTKCSLNGFKVMVASRRYGLATGLIGWLKNNTRLGYTY